MNTVFIGGSRHVSRLPAQVKERLHSIVARGHHVIVGDANGADKAVQKYLFDAAYGKVTVFCSGDRARNNVGHWTVQNVTPPKTAKGFAFYAAKDREMAQKADVGLMIWDGKSPGTVLNVLRLIQAGKMAVLMNVPEKTPITIKSSEHWRDFLRRCSSELQDDLRERATPDEWEVRGIGEPVAAAQLDLLEAAPSEPPPPVEDTPRPDPPAAPAKALLEEELATCINLALAAGEAKTFLDALGSLARARGVTSADLADAGAEDSQIGMVLKTMAALGLRLEVGRV